MFYYACTHMAIKFASVIGSIEVCQLASDEAIEKCAHAHTS